MLAIDGVLDEHRVLGRRARLSRRRCRIVGGAGRPGSVHQRAMAVAHNQRVGESPPPPPMDLPVEAAARLSDGGGRPVKRARRSRVPVRAAAICHPS